ncbi:MULTISPECIES: antibiotic biosynthesis monooxygenase [Microbacterium]|uniref:ABM domain-containing protein n=1 Tax=Microbacterium wangchenii TaxID=2541726 RepID=A0ABX5SVJ8_9MICO|nr:MULTISPECIES: antibiotic biosynthesis monooxygenase [Microbacterium]MCK6067935.1 antibiotic biosynthesis monooxygenase [Microbacterium sp. EYE_512]QBR89182.1 hypothetical protein E4K62_11095 [Microbacterium wangchenii]
MNRFAPTMRDSRATSAFISCWNLRDRQHQLDAAEAALATMPAAPGLVRFSILRGLEDDTLLVLAQWTDADARDGYLADTHIPRDTVDARVPGIQRLWRVTATPHRVVSGPAIAQEPGCFVLIRQPLTAAEPEEQRTWIHAEIAALTATASQGVIATTFYATDDGSPALALAEWTSEEAHRTATSARAIAPSDVTEPREGGSDPLDPPTGRRYAFIGAVGAER